MNLLSASIQLHQYPHTHQAPASSSVSLLRAVRAVMLVRPQHVRWGSVSWGSEGSMKPRRRRLLSWDSGCGICVASAGACVCVRVRVEHTCPCTPVAALLGTNISSICQAQGPAPAWLSQPTFPAGPNLPLDIRYPQGLTYVRHQSQQCLPARLARQRVPLCTAG